MWRDWILTGWTDVAMVLLSVAVLYVAIILYTRAAGLRSFAKMSAFDFAMTVAIGSLFAASAATRSPPLLLALVAFAGLYGGQWAIGWVRSRSERARWVLDNDPLLLMAGDRILRAHLDAAQITEADLRAKLREANVLNLGQVRAVVLETTGDVSVLHASDASQRLDSALLEGVVGWEELAAAGGTPASESGNRGPPPG